MHFLHMISFKTKLYTSDFITEIKRSRLTITKVLISELILQVMKNLQHWSFYKFSRFGVQENTNINLTICLEWLPIVKTLLLEVSRQMPCNLSGVIKTRASAISRLIKYIILYIRAFDCKGTVDGIFQVTRYLESVMSDSQQYSLDICPRADDVDIHIFLGNNWGLGDLWHQCTRSRFTVSKISPK